MFPLGSVLFPGGLLPLRVFEPRYRVLVERCLESDSVFGVALIERGFEVGGGDERSMVGTLAQILECVEVDEGQYALVAQGGQRVKIARWRDDDPHPWAEVEPWPDEGLEGIEHGAGALDESLTRVAEMLSRCFDSAAVRLQRPDLVGGPELPDDPLEASWLASDAAPLSAHDRQRLLATPGVHRRLDLLAQVLSEHLETAELLGELDS